MSVRKRVCPFVVFAALLAVAASATAHEEFQTESGWNDQLFPSFIIATAGIRLPDEAVEDREDEQVLGDAQGLLGVTLEAEEADTEVTVTVTCDAIMEPSTFKGTLAEAGETYTIFPKIKFKYDQLAKNIQSTPISVTFTVQLEDEDEQEETKTLILRSINDCPFTLVEGEDAVDVSFMFAAYVNEQHPFVDKILREALNTGIVNAFTGYQAKDKKEVYRQAYALWHALSLRDLRYSSVTTTSADSDSVNSQHVRLIDESINNSQANCVDGSVLFASLLRKVGIEPVLVIVPGHCYVGFVLDPEGKEIAALETTILGGKLEEAVEIEGLDDVVAESWHEQNSWRTFTAALATGNQDFEKNAEHFQNEEDPNYQLIGVAAARRMGILPIAFQSNREFVASPAPSSGEAESN